MKSVGTLAKNRSNELFSVFNKELTQRQSVALKFLFAYMPLNDLADYSGEFFLANADRALMAIDQVPWGKAIPEDIFLHYVLPCRVNNENLDSFRIEYYDEIHTRIKGMDLEKAALEINYWAQEKVTYQPADIRTSGPMSTILSAQGRCGEESTFTVAALRTAGIPARQVYTPRWAHTDDNHAWVEIWNNGKWNYMGACEPEPVFDKGWFTEVARRAMLVHTKSFGAAYGNENYINVYPYYSEVNNLAKYAETKRIYVKVQRPDGKPVQGASVDYCLYNYSEFFPLTTVPTGENGLSSFETGFGDLLVWAHSGEEFAWAIISVEKTDTLALDLKPHDGRNYIVEADLTAPPALQPYPGIPEEEARRNAERLQKGNFIRESYINSWITDDEIRSVAGKLNTDPGKTRTVFKRSMGNYNEIWKFLMNTPDSLRQKAFWLLEVLPDKDLRDTKSAILADHLLNSVMKPGISNDMFINYVLNSRIDNEMMIAWRSFFLKSLSPELTGNAISDPELIRDYLDKNIVINDEENYYKTPLTPAGVFQLRVSDTHSRAICFIAICRSLGIPARLEPGRSIPQYWSENKWHDIYFTGQKTYSGQKGFLKLTTEQKNPEPQYYTNFTLARYEGGRYTTLDYEFSRKVTGFEELELPAGNYMLVTGNRPDDKRIFAGITFFNLTEGEHKAISVNVRNPERTKHIYGKADLTSLMKLFPDEKNISADSWKGTVILWLDPVQEPSRHVFSDLPPFKKELDLWGGNFLFISATDLNVRTNDLPSKSYFGTDKGLSSLEKYVHLSKHSEIKLPFIIIVNSREEIVFTSSGYRIGTGEQILKYVP